MSLHASISQEAAAKLAAQRRNSTISSVLIALLLCALIAVILWVISLTPIFKNNDETISYSSAADKDTEITKPEITNQVEKKPSSPSSSAAKVIASTTPSPTAVPVPEIEITEPSLDFGDGDDFGNGWGDGGNGGGSGNGGGGGATFFKQKIQAERICYVIDYSQSMSGKKIKLMKEELTKSIKKLPKGLEYQLIFFAGPAWIAGDDLEMAEDKKTAIVESDSEEYKWRNKARNDWTRSGTKQPVKWLKSTSTNRRRSIEAIEETKLVWGTTWNDPLEMALEMTPQPDHIFFMTDGSPGAGLQQAERTARKISARAKSSNIKINTIGLLVPKAKEALELLSKKTGGEFTLIEE